MQGHLGRSALEAVELTNVGSNYLRGHVERDVFINYAVRDAGGTAPNIVPDHASVIYLLRAATQQHVHNTALRLYDIARGAALMTGTSLEISVESGLSELIPNRSLEHIMHDRFLQVGIVPPSEDDIKFAADIHNTFPKNAEESTFENLRYLYGKAAEEIILEIKGKLVEDIIYPYVPIPHAKYGSTDVCDVSWFTPTAQLTAACYAKDTPGHSWQIVAQGKRELCMNGMLTAAKVMSLTAVELFENAYSLRKVRDEFLEAIRFKTYICPIPEQKVFN
jgi:aminobenzoyl-glutamate utilization protein B